MGTNSESGNETYHEVPASAYWYLGDRIGVVPKGFFKYTISLTVLLTASATVIACKTDWWQQFFAILGNQLFVVNWFIGWPLLAGTIIYFGFIRNRKKRGEHKK